MSKIKTIQAREILDSKGNPTVEVDLVTNLGTFQAAVPSGVSKGKHEALELRDGGKRYGGMGVQKAVKNVNEIIGPALNDKDPRKQKEIDDLMIELDGTKNKSKLGANAILAVSMAVCRAGAAAQNLSLYEYIFQLMGQIIPTIVKKTFSPPIPCFLMIEGGLHAGNKLDVQEFMLAFRPNSVQVSKVNSFEERLRMGAEIYQGLGQILERKYGRTAKNVGLEGGFAVSGLEKTEQALGLMKEVIDWLGYKNKAGIILDVAASHFFKNRAYRFEGGTFTKEGMLNFYSNLVEDYPILGLEDPFSEDDWQGWRALSSRLKAQGSKTLLIGDDLITTNPERIERASKENCIKAVAIKPNQVGTVSETLKAVKIAREAGLEVFVKHRAGETNDDFIADLAVGVGARYIMAGPPCRGERVAKYNRLLKIEEEIDSL